MPLGTLARIGLETGCFYYADKVMTKRNLQNPYYGLHAIHNAAIVYLTAPDIRNTIQNFHSLWDLRFDKNMWALELVFALHIYHILAYYKKLRFDDWLHHILMIGIALPIGTYLDSGPLLGYSLFFTTGLPGGIDYALLFLNRNGFLRKDIEKKVNCWLNTWIRSPGTASHAVLTTIFILQYVEAWTLAWYLGLLTAVLNYWNGQYFMNQVVYDAGHNDVYSQYKSQ
jgi:hypothetical protein